LEQQTATSQVLQVISSSPGDLEPVFTTILENAARICDAKFGNIYLWDGDAFRLVAAHNTPLAFAASRRAGPFRPKPSYPFSRMVANKKVIHVADAGALPAYIERDPEIVAPVELGGVRTCLAVPMLKENEVIGALIVYRQEVRTFTDKQIALVASFASQAVIAIENTRLLNELRQRTTDLTESLERQTATSEVLQVISSSPGDVEPVFQAMLENAVRICDATFGNIYRWDGENLHLVAANNTPGSFVQTRARIGLHPGADDPVGRMIMTKAVVHTADLAAEREYIERRNPGIIAAVEVGGVRTFLAVPLLKDNQLIGSFHLSRQEVRPFTEKQITLITDFAAQAVVAIENARLLTELHQRTDDLTEALGQQPFHLRPADGARYFGRILGAPLCRR
jgi:GAF domain-containing protein